jgi:membrane associated rhomboid family serine protease
MGLEDRDYYRTPTSGYAVSGFFDLNPVVKYLILTNIVVYLLQIFITRPATVDDFAGYYGDSPEHFEELSEEVHQFTEYLPRISVIEPWLQLQTDKVLKGQVWRLITCAFCHSRDSVTHILFNMLFLFWFGKTLEMMYGPREFLLFYMTSAIVSSLAHVGLDLLTDSNVPAIGASGAVMAVLMLYAIHYPRDTINLFLVLPIPIWLLVAGYVIYDLHPVLLALAGDHLYTGIAHSAHLGGLAFGFLYWRFNLRLLPIANQLRRFQIGRRFGSRRSIRLHKPSRSSKESLDEQVDGILQKIHDAGESSLTDDERDVLRIASEKYQDRR